MYKYSKLIKERMLKDNFLAFLWILYRLISPCNVEFEQELNMSDEIKYIIFADFDSIAMKTLKNGHSALLYYVLKLEKNIINDA